MSEDDVQRLNQLSASSSASYVYPVRSLLNGIKPRAGQKAGSGAGEYCTLDDPPYSYRAFAAEAAAQKDATSHEPLQRSTSRPGVVSPSPSMTLPTESTTTQTPDTDTRSRRRPPSPNFRDFSPDQNPLSPRTFSTALGSGAPAPRSAEHSPPRTTPMSEPVEEPVLSSAAEKGVADAEDRLLDYKARHPPQFAGVVSQAFTDAVDLLPVASDTVTAGMEADAGIHAHFSHSGIVHLPPRQVDSALSATTSRSIGPTSRGRASPRCGNSADSPRTAPAQEELDVVQMPSTQDDRGPRSLLNSVGTGTGSISSSIASEEPRISFRHQHIEDKNGHHLIVGREGKLSRCEDEVWPLHNYKNVSSRGRSLSVRPGLLKGSASSLR